MIKIPLYKIIFVIIFLLSLVGAIVLSGIDSFILSLFTAAFYSVVPGYSILLVLQVRKQGFWIHSVYSIGLSISFIIFTGLIFNWFWFLLGQAQPLRPELLLFIITTVLGIFLIFGYVRNKNLSYTIKIPSFNILTIIFFIVPPIITGISILGSIVLNNGGSNALAITTLFLIAGYILLASFFSSKVSENVFPWSLYFLSLSLLFMISLRSWYISGYDIQDEFKVFQLTKTLGFWSPENIKHTYNACLSITILPTIQSFLTRIPDIYIYKALYQLLFATVPVVIYVISKRYTTSLLSFLAVIYIIAQPFFIQPTTSLARQEIGFIFFSLLLLTLFNKELTQKLRNILMIIIGLSMILSHYSTSYLTIFLLAASYLLLGIYRLTEKSKLIRKIYSKLRITRLNTHYAYFINPFILIFLLISTILWYGVINDQRSQLDSIARDTISNMNKFLSSDIKSSESQKSVSFIPSEKKDSLEEIRAYEKKQYSLIGGDAIKLYPANAYQNTNVYPLVPLTVQPLVQSQVNTYILLVLEVLKQIFKFLVILGPIFIFFRLFRTQTISREYIVLCGVASAFIALMIFHPTLGLHYNLSRFYLQLLFFLSLPAILFATFFLKIVKKANVYILSLLIVSLFLYLTGAIYHVAGGEARMYLNNFGEDYDKFYTHKQEIVSARWLEAERERKANVFADEEAKLRIKTISDMSINTSVFPALIYKDAYVYGSYSNVISNRARLSNEGSYLLFSYPQEFLEDNKNLIYSNGQSKIYK